MKLSVGVPFTQGMCSRAHLNSLLSTISMHSQPTSLWQTWAGIWVCNSYNGNFQKLTCHSIYTCYTHPMPVSSTGCKFHKNAFFISFINVWVPPCLALKYLSKRLNINKMVLPKVILPDKLQLLHWSSVNKKQWIWFIIFPCCSLYF